MFCLSVCLSVRPLINTSPLEHLFILKTIPHTQQAKTCVDFSKTTPLQRYTISCIVWLSVPSAILETAHAHYQHFKDSHTHTRYIHTKGLALQCIHYNINRLALSPYLMLLLMNALKCRTLGVYNAHARMPESARAIETQVVPVHC